MAACNSSCCPLSMYTGDATARWSTVGLPVDPLLGADALILPQLPLQLGSLGSTVARTAAPSVIINEGISPVPVKIVERIR